MQETTEMRARRVYEQYMEEGLQMFPPFKGYGMKLVQFAIDEPELYRALFLSPREVSYRDYLENEMQWERILPSIRETLELDEADAKWLLYNLSFYCMGMGALFASSACVMTEEEIAENLGNVCRGMLMELKAPHSDQVAMMPTMGGEAPGTIEQYIRGKKNTIIGYSFEKELHRIRLDVILYFEAVGENVFAYTKGNVYEIKQRLYQIEDQVKDMGFVRASKSLLVNVQRITSVTPDEGGRGRLNMSNGETVMASRSYLRQVLAAVRDI